MARECDLVHCFAIRAMLTAILAGTGKPLILHALIPNPDRLDRVVCHFADVVICNSKATANRFAHFANPEIVYNGVYEPKPRGEPLPRVRTGDLGVLGFTAWPLEKEYELEAWLREHAA